MNSYRYGSSGHIDNNYRGKLDCPDRTHKSETKKGINRTTKNKTFKGQAKKEVRENN